jgi:hypothetical protein
MKLMMRFLAIVVVLYSENVPYHTPYLSKVKPTSG